MNPIGPLAAPHFPTRSPAPEARSIGAAPPEAAAPAVPMGPNPRLRLDPALGVVVMEFRGAADHVVRSLPNEQELRAYRLAQRTGGEPTEPHNFKPR